MSTRGLFDRAPLCSYGLFFRLAFAPCSRFEGDIFPQMQFGLDLFKNWVF